MPPRTVAFVAPPETGHFARLRALITGVVDAGWRAVVFTDARFADAVAERGAEFVDLYARYPVTDADDTSVPWSARHVSYAGHYTEQVTEVLREAAPSLVVYDSFSLVARLAAERLGLPHVRVRSGHNLDPARFRERIHEDVRVHVSPRCAKAVENLRTRYGIEDASPFSYMATHSAYLNLYCEPPEYLCPVLREAFSPVECIGSLDRLEPAPAATSPFGPTPAGTRKVYVSFGTVIWRFFADVAARALREITRVLTERGDMRVLVSLGGYRGEVPELGDEHVRVRSYVDQWAVLSEADVFITHHGLNSTHEAACLRVPMISYPFFWDQPGLAAKCAELGIATPLVDTVRGPVTPGAVDHALARLDAEPDAWRARLNEAREWERRVVADRERVTRRILDLAEG